MDSGIRRNDDLGCAVLFKNGYKSVIFQRELKLFSRSVFFWGILVYIGQ